MSRITIGKCFRCTKNLKAKLSGIRSKMSLSCSCGEYYYLKITREEAEELRKRAERGEDFPFPEIVSKSGLSSLDMRRIPDYESYLERVGLASYIDITRRTDPACSNQAWDKLDKLFEEYGAPWIVQIWTKGARGALKRGRRVLEKLREAGTTLTCHLTVTGLGKKWEPAVPWPIDWEGIKNMVAFIEPQAVCWRYDPVVPGVSSLKDFETIAKHFSDLGVCVASIKAVNYSRENIRETMGDLVNEIDTSVNVIDFLRKAGEISRSYDIELSVCAESRDLAQTCNLASRGCGDYDWFTKISKQSYKPKFRPSRTGCACLDYYDIGEYGPFDKCHGCVYCYAHR